MFFDEGDEVYHARTAMNINESKKIVSNAKGIYKLTNPIENPRYHPIQIAWMAIYLACMLTEVFILCWFGNELILKSLELSRAAYEGPWMKLDPKTTMLIIVFMERCKRPLQVTAGKIFTLSLDTYTNLINWSYKAFAVMRNMKK